MDTTITEDNLRQILTPQLLTAVYNLKWPYVKGQRLSGAQIGRFHFQPDAKYVQSFYDIVFHQAYIPMSDIPLEAILDVDLTSVLPDPDAADYPEQALGLITLLDQARFLNVGYGLRYSRAFFDPIAERLFRQLIAQPKSTRPDSKVAWTSRGYSFEDWLVRVLWFWGPPVHSDTFMTQNRQAVKNWLHDMRSEVEQYADVKDPLREYDAADNGDTKVFMKLFTEGPPQKSLSKPDEDATVVDYAFWWIRILNSHFAITDFAGRYPFWVRHSGQELSEKDQVYLEKCGNILEGGNETLFDDIRQDVLQGKWKPLPTNEAFEYGSNTNRRRRPLGEHGHGPVVLPKKSG